MPDINERQSILPVQPSNPGRGPGQRRQRPQRGERERQQGPTKRDPKPGGRVVDEYV